MGTGSWTTTRLGAVLLGAAIAMSACSTQGGDGETAAPAAAAPAAAEQGATSGKGVTSGTGAAKPGSAKPGSAKPGSVKLDTGALAPYFAAAERADAQLRRAATLVNGGMTKDQLRIDPAAVRAIRAASPEALAATVPAGMPPQVMRAVLLTYSEIASRYYAMRFVLEAGDARREVVVPRSRDVSPTLAEIVGALGNGAPAAARFGRDLASAKTLADGYDPLPGSGPRSRAAAEIGVRLQNIVTANGCCVETGGELFTSLAPLRWSGGREGSSWMGTVSGIGFRTTWTGTRWNPQLEAG